MTAKDYNRLLYREYKKILRDYDQDCDRPSEIVRHYTRDFSRRGQRGHFAPPELYFKWLNDKINFII